MANEHLQKYFRMKPEVEHLFEDLEIYKQFCIDYGYVYDEKNLYDPRSPYGEYIKMTKGREPWDQWRTPRRFKNEHRNHFHKAH
jgi:hypothetical protein